MLQNAYSLAKIGADTAENEQHFSEILPIGRRVAHAPTSEKCTKQYALFLVFLGSRILLFFVSQTWVANMDWLEVAV